MSSPPKLTPFSYVILVLVGENGAGPHDLVRMMRDGRIYWTAPESQFYAEPKRLEAAGYLAATKQPGRTHDRTHYTLTQTGRAALAEWLATPTRFPRIQNEPVLRLLGSQYAERGVLLESLAALRTELDELDESLQAAEEREPDLPHRTRVLSLNRRLAQRIVDAHRQWLDEVEAEL
jgi:DNA-binding PadR family transcriptional regulator